MDRREEEQVDDPGVPVSTPLQVGQQGSSENAPPAFVTVQAAQPITFSQSAPGPSFTRQAQPAQHQQQSAALSPSFAHPAQHQQQHAMQSAALSGPSFAFQAPQQQQQSPYAMQPATPSPSFALQAAQPQSPYAMQPAALSGPSFAFQAPQQQQQSPYAMQPAAPSPSFAPQAAQPQSPYAMQPAALSSSFAFQAPQQQQQSPFASQPVQQGAFGPAMPFHAQHRPHPYQPSFTSPDHRYNLRSAVLPRVTLPWEKRLRAGRPNSVETALRNLFDMGLISPAQPHPQDQLQPAPSFFQPQAMQQQIWPQPQAPVPAAPPQHPLLPQAPRECQATQTAGPSVEERNSCVVCRITNPDGFISCGHSICKACFTHQLSVKQACPDPRCLKEINSTSYTAKK